VSIGPLLQREQNLRCPPADEDRRPSISILVAYSYG
jgi:hypothetical protein